MYFYDPNFPGFHLLYDFGGLPGEYWYYQYHTWCGSLDVDSIKVTVDSIDVVIINSIPLKRLFVQYDSVNFEYGTMWPELPHNSIIIESIGDLRNLFYSATFDEMIFDSPWPSDLRCYEDSIIGHYETGIVDSCTWVNFLNVPEENENTFLMSPNPVSENVTFSLPVVSYSVAGSDGRVVLTWQGQEVDFADLSELCPGIYFTSATLANGRTVRQTVVKK